MCKQVDDNRKILSKIVFSKQSFTADEIINEYRAKQGNVIIDGLESVRDFLKSLEENGALTSQRGRYVVLP